VRWQEQLDSILAETVAGARERERHAFDRIAGPFARSVVLYGAGNLGRRTLRALRRHHLDPVAFADANPALDGKQVEGVPVYSPQAAAEKFGKSAVFVVCVWHPDRRHGVQDIINRLAGLGAERVTSFVPLFWKYAEALLPYFFWELPSNVLPHADRLRRACELLDSESRELFVSQLRFRIHADFANSGAVSALPAYFPKDLFALTADECFVDCGAFDGDTIQEFIQQSGGLFRRIVAFEPDPRNYDKLQAFLDADKRIKGRASIHKAGVREKAEMLRFSATGGDDAAIRHDGEIVIECETLDQAVGSLRPTLIKMDIEGSERPALTGGLQTIGKVHPILAVSVYHKPEDIWDLPLYMHELGPDSRLALRMYWRDGFDLVCYSVPRERMSAAA